MPKKLFIKTDRPESFIQIEFNPQGFETSCVSSEQVPKWIVNSDVGRETLHPHIVKEATVLGKSYDLQLHDPIQFREV